MTGSDPWTGRLAAAGLAALAMAASDGCDPPLRFRSDEGRFVFGSQGLAPPTVTGDLGPSAAFVAGSKVSLDIIRYCLAGFGGDCADHQLNGCVRLEVPASLPLDDAGLEDGVPPQVEVAPGFHRIRVDAADCGEVEGREVRSDDLSLRGVPPEAVSATFLPEWMPTWVAARAMSDDDRAVIVEGVEHGAVPAPADSEGVVPVGPGDFSPPILLRDPAGVPLATDTGFVRFATLAGRPTYPMDATDLPDMGGTFDEASVRLHEGDRLAVTVQAAGSELGTFEVEVVPEERVASVELAVAYVPVQAVEDADEGTLVAAAAVRDDQGRMLRSGDVRFEVEGEGFEGGPETFAGGLALYGVGSLAGPRSLRCATVTASVGPQRDSTQVCWEPPHEGCACTTGAPAPAGLLPGLGLLLALRRRRTTTP